MRCFSGRGLARGYERGRAHIRALNRAHALSASGAVPTAADTLLMTASAATDVLQPASASPTESNLAKPFNAHPHN